ncbi:hypothetical protein AHiyo8_18990 [Arthrobacter sp. Hiyo8]|nr:hypothetical protein AHiyo8_18990 [Arthrobacter sp. Hiyo8]
MDDGARLAFELLADTAAMLPRGLPAAFPEGSLLGIGAAVAGVEASTANSHELAVLLSERFKVPAAVLSDATAAQLGALHGAPGTVLIVGTGLLPSASTTPEPSTVPMVGDRSWAIAEAAAGSASRAFRPHYKLTTAALPRRCSARLPRL